MNVKVTSFANSPPTKCRIVHNGARIRKLEKEVLPPQCVAVGGHPHPRQARMLLLASQERLQGLAGQRVLALLGKERSSAPEV